MEDKSFCDFLAELRIISTLRHPNIVLYMGYSFYLNENNDKW